MLKVVAKSLLEKAGASHTRVLVDEQDISDETACLAVSLRVCFFILEGTRDGVLVEGSSDACGRVKEREVQSVRENEAGGVLQE